MSPPKSLAFLKKVRIALRPRSRLLRTRLQNGALIEGYNRAGHVGHGIYLYGDSLGPELFALLRFLRPGCAFVDAGANVGAYTIKAAKEVGNDGLVAAVEPFIETAARLLQNVRANGYRNVRVRPVCIGPVTERARLELNNSKPNSYGLSPTGNAESVSVLSISLNALCRWENLQRLDYLKIDAEGAQGAVLVGSEHAIGRFRPIVQVEITRCDSALRLNHRRFAASASPNNVFIPSENLSAVATAFSLGWAEISNEMAS